MRITGVIIHKSCGSYETKRLLSASKSRSIILDCLTPDRFGLVVYKSDTKSLLIDDIVHPIPDFVLPRMGSATSYYDFSVIRQLECVDSVVCNHSHAIAMVKDKLYMHQMLARSRLASPRTMLLKFPVAIDVVEREIGFPLVIKKVTGTNGKGIYLCQNQSQFEDVMELLDDEAHTPNFILQEFIETSHGRDLRVFVVGGKVVGCMQRKSQSGFKANVAKGAHVEAFPITPEIEWLATETAKLFDLDIAGIDLLFDKDGFKVCEANSSPGFEGLEKVTGPCIAEKILDYMLVKLGYNECL